MAFKTDAGHPFYKPLWRRIVITAICAAWTAYEVFFGGDGMWLVFAAGMTAYAVWTFFIAWPKDEPPAAGPPAA